VFEEINRDMRDLLRHLQGKDYPPTAMIIDSRTMQSTPESGGRAGYDAGKKKKGSKTHVAVDIYGNLIALLVTPANQSDRDMAYDLAVQVQQATGESVQICFADGAYSGQVTADSLAACGIELVVIKRTDGQVGFKVLPKRWIVERTLGWLSRFKRFARDYERLPEALAHLQLVAFVMLLMPKLFGRIVEVHTMLVVASS
jgi:transposase